MAGVGRRRARSVLLPTGGAYATNAVAGAAVFPSVAAVAARGGNGAAPRSRARRVPNHLTACEDTLALGVEHLASKCALEIHCRSRCRITAVMAEPWRIALRRHALGPSLHVATETLRLWIPRMSLRECLDAARLEVGSVSGDSYSCRESSGVIGGQTRSKTSELRLCIFCLTAARCLRCAGCKGPWYCCIECQRQDWEARHKEECAGRHFWRAVRKALRRRHLPLPLVQKVHSFLSDADRLGVTPVD